MSKTGIESEIQIDAPIDVVWDVITKSEHIGKWFAPTKLDARLGGRGIVTAHGDTEIEVVKFDKPHTFAYEWAPADSEGNISLVEFTLIEEGAGTKLRVTESTDRFTDEKLKAEFTAGHNGGWAAFIPKLAAYAPTVAAQHA